MVAVERGIEFTEGVGNGVIFSADHDPIRFHAVVNGSAFFQKFRVGGDVEGEFPTPLIQHFGHFGFDLIGRAHGDGGFVDDDFFFRHVGGVKRWRWCWRLLIHIEDLQNHLHPVGCRRL